MMTPTRLSRSDLVGLVSGNLQNPIFSSVVEALCRALDETSLRLLMFSGRRNQPIDHVLEYGIGALVTINHPVSDQLVEDCRRAGVPIILFNREPLHDSTYSVTSDNFAGGRALAHCVIAGGHQRIACIGLPESSTSGRDREEGFMSLLKERGRSLFLREQSDFSARGAAAAMRRLLHRPEQPDAVFCANDWLALAALGVAQAEFGLAIGYDISIVGFDDVPQAAHPGLDLTTYSQPAPAVAGAILSLIQDLRNGIAREQRVVVPGKLIARSSARLPSCALSAHR